MIRHVAIGFAMAAVFVGLLVYFNVMGLQSLLATEEKWFVALFVLWFGNGTVFGALQVAYAVMDQAEE